MTRCNNCTASSKAVAKVEGEKNPTNKLTEHSEKLSVLVFFPQNPELKYYLQMGTGFEEKTALFTILKRKYHLTNPDFDHLLLYTSYKVKCFLFFK